MPVSSQGRRGDRGGDRGGRDRQERRFSPPFASSHAPNSSQQSQESRRGYDRQNVKEVITEIRRYLRNASANLADPVRALIELAQKSVTQPAENNTREALNRIERKIDALTEKTPPKSYASVLAGISNLPKPVPPPTASPAREVVVHFDGPIPPAIEKEPTRKLLRLSTTSPPHQMQ